MNLSESYPAENQIASKKARHPWIWDILLIGILIIGAFFRFVGLNWDGPQHLHPDERFLTMVETSISPVKSLGDYFNTQISTLNPHNQGFGFYVYGTLPLFLVRYVAEWVGMTGYDEVNLVGRFASAVFDLGVVLLIYLIVLRLYRNYRMALLASAFSAFAVMQIQLSHYFTVDTFANFFIFLSFYFAVRIMTGDEKLIVDEENPSAPGNLPKWIFGQWKTIIPYLLFGMALGMAAASKVSTAPTALLLPGAVAIKYFKISKGERDRLVPIFIRNIVLAAIMALLVFRICQPMAFSGPGFLGLKPNDKWVQNLKDLSEQSNGDVDFPPALQWARRPITFAWTNMVEWGFGIPLGLLAWASFFVMGWKILKGEWQKHSMIWGWTFLYFIWQATNFTRSMRYQLAVYPTLAIIAAWGVFAIWEWGVSHQEKTGGTQKVSWRKLLAFLVGFSVLGATFLWAFAFTQIYTRPVTRVAASKWIYQNVPGPINLQIEQPSGTYNQPQPFRSGAIIPFGKPLKMAFSPQSNGLLTGVSFTLLASSNSDVVPKTLSIVVTQQPTGDEPIAAGTLVDNFNNASDSRGKSYEVPFENTATLDKDKIYYIWMNVLEDGQTLNAAGPIELKYMTTGGLIKQALPEPVDAITNSNDYTIQFTAAQSGKLKHIVFPHIVNWEGDPSQKTLEVTIEDTSAERNVLGAAKLTNSFLPADDPRGTAFIMEFNAPIQIKAQNTYFMQFKMTSGQGSLAFYGSRQANESSWDDPLPVGLDGYNPFDYSTGVYRTELNFEMYWDDNAEKLDRFLTTLDQADYIFISSNRQWGTTVRVPERYPLTTEYYRQLIGCPLDKDIVWCYSVANPGMFKGNLGFDLVYINQSDPNLGSIKFNDQFAEEAFTVYDHPKVLIFRKNPSYDSAHTRSLLTAVDLTNVIHLTPRQAKSYPGNLMLPETRLIQQRLGGTWSALFNRMAFLNQYPYVGVVIWYLAVLLLGLICYPLTRFVMGGLPDKGYPLSRLLGMLLLSYMAWAAGSGGISFGRLSIGICLLIIILINSVLFVYQKNAIIDEWKTRRKYFWLIEGLFLAIFLVDLFVRIGNPDLWHPYKGGEKPMDFSYFNAVLKSTTFPPYDPWFAGGYINYYYYGFVLMGVLVKFLGIVPSIAYNLILPTMFAFLGIGAFSIGYNLLSVRKKSLVPGSPDDLPSSRLEKAPIYAGIASTLGLLFLGNLGTVRMIWQGLQKLAAPAGSIDGAGWIQSFIWSFQGLVKYFEGNALPYSPGDWYWIPSRAIPGEPITEFPAFTFLYADPHAHMFALPLTILALSWALSILLGKWRWEKWQLPATLIMGGLFIGVLRPTNTWDLPVYLGLGMLSVIYVSIKYSGNENIRLLNLIPQKLRGLSVALVSSVLLLILTFILYQPFAQWYGGAYNAVGIWEGDHTPFWSYMTHWGLFIFLITSWIFWETIDWMAKTPVSSLNKLRPATWWIRGGIVVSVAIITGMLIYGIEIAWLVIILILWTAILIFRPGQEDYKRAVLIMILGGLSLTLMVELIVLKGDIGRMNTVFKFYLQAWTLLSLSAAASLILLFPIVVEKWKSGWRTSWQVVLVLLVGGAALFPVLAGMDKIQDRISKNAPHGLDGMTYMLYSTYSQEGKELNLSHDYPAILWMQANVIGSPVIVEGNTPEYQWGSRFTIYTGLPGVVGWNWHQRQQRAVVDAEVVTNRVAEIGQFYQTTNRLETEKFLQKYDVSYIVVGQLEENIYPAVGLDKFKEWNGGLWASVYQDGDTTIYKVNKQASN